MDRTKLRIVSLIPSATEIVAALGYADCLVGRSHECDYPTAVLSLPICTEPKFDPVGTSSQIHQRVTDLLTSALSVYRVKTEVLADLRPTHIITQAQCEVCAVSLTDVEKAVAELLNAEPVSRDTPVQVISLQPERLADLWTDIARVSVAFDTSTAGQVTSDRIVTQLKNRLHSFGADDVIKETLSKEIPPKEISPKEISPKKTLSKAFSAEEASLDQELPTIACIEWTDPLMAAGNWVPELVSLVGGCDCFGKTGKHSDWMSWDELVSADPDIIVVLPCGYDLSQTRQATEEMAKHPNWSQLKAVKHQNVYLTDGNQYFNRPGPRLVESGEILAEIIQKRAVNIKRQPKGWQNWNDRSC